MIFSFLALQCVKLGSPRANIQHLSSRPLPRIPGFWLLILVFHFVRNKKKNQGAFSHCREGGKPPLSCPNLSGSERSRTRRCTWKKEALKKQAKIKGGFYFLVFKYQRKEQSISVQTKSNILAITFLLIISSICLSFCDQKDDPNLGGSGLGSEILKICSRSCPLTF